MLYFAKRMPSAVRKSRPILSIRTDLSLSTSAMWLPTRQRF
jgi:hypothetical protein